MLQVRSDRAGWYLRLFIHGIEVDVTTNSDRAAHEIEAAGLAIERALHDVPPAGSHV